LKILGVFMHDYPVLSVALRERVLSYLGRPMSSPGTRAVNTLLRAYTTKVPWESVFRIAKRMRTPILDQCPRWPEEFWTDAIEHGGGGTCFESNYAFLALLRSMGYEGYLTINHMGESIGCHAAIVLLVDGQKQLLDVGIPLHKTLQLHPDRMTRVSSAFHTYIVTPQPEGQYLVERTHHPKRYIYTLVDKAVANDPYQTAVTQDYGTNGLFLDRVIMTKVIDEKIWRFNSSDHPLRLEAFDRSSKTEILLPERLLARRLASHFGMDRQIIQDALDAVGSNPLKV
jgi:arylamine N-acetyltransferase